MFNSKLALPKILAGLTKTVSDLEAFTQQTNTEVATNQAAIAALEAQTAALAKEAKDATAIKSNIQALLKTE